MSAGKGTEKFATYSTGNYIIYSAIALLKYNSCTKFEDQKVAVSWSDFRRNYVSLSSHVHGAIHVSLTDFTLSCLRSG